ncbi:MAG: tannase/feruloyl esterase family alpha/beta hydrolase, partial [Vicinamibacterales bacterium]
MNHRACLPSVLLLTALLCADQAEAAGSCEDLARLALPAARVLSAQRVASGTFSPTGASAGGALRQAFAKLPTFCRVVVSSKPSVDSDIQIEVWLPESGWNGRLQAVGDGGLAGSIPFASMAPALSEGYATSGTDTGHVGGNADFMPAHPE